MNGMSKGIGAAADYYRLRLRRFDDGDTPDFEWHDDILWRQPADAQLREFDRFLVEAVALDDDDVTSLGVFESSDDAHEALDAAVEDLAGLTRSEFEARYFPAEV